MDGPRADGIASIGVFAAAVTHPSAADNSGATWAAGTHDNGHRFLTECLLALLGALAALALRLLRRAAKLAPPAPTSSQPRRVWAARAPPPRLFLSLCVFRL